MQMYAFGKKKIKGLKVEGQIIISFFMLFKSQFI